MSVGSGFASEDGAGWKMSKLDDAIRDGQSLDPDDRLRLIARLWESMPEDHWAAPGAGDKAEVKAMLAADDVQRMADLPRRIALQVAGVPVLRPTTKIYSAPRRFDLATIFVVTSAYSLLFALMNASGFAPVASLIVGAFITFVGGAQALLFGGRYPRAASLAAGAVAAIPIALVSVMLTRRGFRGEEMFFAIPSSAIFGAGGGYVAGVLVGGVFLIADVVRRWFDRRATSQLESP